MATTDVVIVGSGVIGMCAALELANAGRHVALVDPHPGSGASFVAAGMIAPVTEAAFGEDALSRLGLRAAAAWPEFAAHLERLTGQSIGYASSGTLLVGLDSSDRVALERQLTLHLELGLDATWERPAHLRAIEPLLAPSVRGGISAPGDHQVDNRRLLAALGTALRSAGVTEMRARCDAVRVESGRVVAAETAAGSIDADTVVLAAGWATSTIAGVPPNDQVALRPVKGQILRLRPRPGVARLGHTVRALVGGHDIYVVPRTTGQVVVGATVEEQGADEVATAGAAYELLRDAIRVVPSLAEAEFLEIRAGLRPGTRDNAPIVGRCSVAGLIYATGHFRHGILLAPLTATLVAALCDGEPMPEWAAVADPARAAARAATHAAPRHAGRGDDAPEPRTDGVPVGRR